ncbi:MULTISPECIES: bifunctional sugar-1-phosphate nucleotidylyltransferase/acetyltransferase [Methanobacterium]|jgi:bifunctional UDP-N-acetylglucosamine pyrophosphorylase/glucosamine-1-phosphate N-acetyltransferase|uniref:Bifunctional protein GlmU n=1 Tax=Methanobacterium bryantii TaxID=2161 RepID=A0A2A2H4J3_METBR|nr:MULTISPECIES: bifunctional sugar-1-phosphate nucleotidylyltransferase/acetyltransferase [Methanobacterium]OEC85609.1 glucose-1-phosphate thymidylyltransferase [Methanobacterium sp. A39]PAV04322.1 glucose-1-phosphate thymidylyltransferase [Methanobacterium bryantii]
MKGVLLTAGEGTRMRPLTLTRPKTMLQVGGKPILQYNLEALRDAGIKDIIMVVGYKKEAIEDYFEDGSSFGVNIDYITQEKRLGTAHAINSARNMINDEFIVLNGDIIVDPKLIVDLISKYKSEEASSILMLTEVEDPSSFGVVEIENDIIKNIIEKPAPGEAPSNLINAGIYLFDKTIFDAIDRTEKSERGEYEITDSLKIQMGENKIVRGLKSNNKWIDVGRPWELLNVNEHFISEMEEDIQGEIEEGVTIHGKVVLGKNSIIRSGTYILGPVFIGEGCDIGPNSYLRKYTYLGNNVNVGNAVEIKNSIIMDGTNVNHLSYVGDSVIGANCNVAAGTNIANLRFDNKNIKMKIKGEKFDCGVRKLGAVFGDNVKTGINSSFNPGVKVGINSAVGSGTIIYEDIPSNTLVLVKQEYKIIKYDN